MNKCTDVWGTLPSRLKVFSYILLFQKSRAVCLYSYEQCHVRNIKDARTSFIFALRIFKFLDMLYLVDKTRGNVKRNWVFGRFLLLETNL